MRLAAGNLREYFDIRSYLMVSRAPDSRIYDQLRIGY
jgi:hypothetical protein